MSINNPYASPPIEAGAVDPEVERIRRALAGPSIGLLALGSLVLAIALLGCGVVLCILYLIVFWDPDSPQFGGVWTWESLVPAPMGIVSWIVVYGAWQMRRLRSYRWAVASAVLALIPQPLVFLAFRSASGRSGTCASPTCAPRFRKLSANRGANASRIGRFARIPTYPLL